MPQKENSRSEPPLGGVGSLPGGPIPLALHTGLVWLLEGKVQLCPRWSCRIGSHPNSKFLQDLLKCGLFPIPEGIFFAVTQVSSRRSRERDPCPVQEFKSNIPTGKSRGGGEPFQGALGFLPFLALKEVVWGLSGITPAWPFLLCHSQPRRGFSLCSTPLSFSHFLFKIPAVPTIPKPLQKLCYPSLAAPGPVGMSPAPLPGDPVLMEMPGLTLPVSFRERFQLPPCPP